MRDASLLDLELPARAGGRRGMPGWAAWGVMALALCFFVLLARPLLTQAFERLMELAGVSGSTDGTAAVPAERERQLSAMNVDDKAQIIVEGETAQERNAAIPISALPLEQTRGFVLAAASAHSTYDTALKCLTQAVYYEAAREPMQGRRAVAQVVLNRMRHPAYPKSVCGVVYQGSERRTGCQFSFTCDGALLRAPMAAPWREAEQVARAALAGYVEKSVGTATHYHADYVLPKWAFQLGKIEQLGRHIFYRFNGNWGRANALSGHYSGMERIPPLNLLALKQRLLANQQGLETARQANGLTVAPHVTDRHAETDVGGRLDMTKEWRLTIPDPVQASSRYREAIEQGAVSAQPQAELAAAVEPDKMVVQ